MKTLWRLIAKSLGEKASEDKSEADRIAIIRFVIVSQAFITNFFIIANAIRHWNN